MLKALEIYSFIHGLTGVVVAMGQDNAKDAIATFFLWPWLLLVLLCRKSIDMTLDIWGAE